MKRFISMTSLAIMMIACGSNNGDESSLNSTVDTTVVPAPPGTDTALESNRMMAPEGVAGMGTTDSTNLGNDTTGKK